MNHIERRREAWEEDDHNVFTPRSCETNRQAHAPNKNIDNPQMPIRFEIPFVTDNKYFCQLFIYQGYVYYYNINIASLTIHTDFVNSKFLVATLMKLSGRETPLIFLSTCDENSFLCGKLLFFTIIFFVYWR